MGWIIPLCLMLFCACSDDDNNNVPEPAPLPEPEITISQGEISDKYFTFNLDVKNATQIAWINQIATEAAPEANKILLEGGLVSTNELPTTISVHNLIPDTEYVVYVAAANEENIVKTAQITIRTIPRLPDYDVTFVACKDKIFENGNHYLKLNDKDWHFEATLDIYADPTAEYLPAGEYKIKDDTTAPVICASTSSIDIYNISQGENGNHRMSEGALTVTVNEDQTYKLELNGTLDNGLLFKGTYEGTMEVEKEEPEPTYDIDQTFTICTVTRYEKGANYYIKLYDSDNEYYTATLDIYTKDAFPTLQPGTYPLAESGDFYMDPYSSFDILRVNETINGSYKFQSGSQVVITLNDDIYTITLEGVLYDPYVDGKTLTLRGSYTGAIKEYY